MAADFVPFCAFHRSSPTRTVVMQDPAITSARNRVCGLPPRRVAVASVKRPRNVAKVRTGAAPPSAPPIDLTAADPPELVLDGHGVATGGVRTPWVDVPVARTSGLGAADNLMAMLFGSGEYFDAGTLERLYPGGSADYLTRFTASLDAAIAAGFLLADDRREILDLAAATYPSPSRGTT